MEISEQVSLPGYTFNSPWYFAVYFVVFVSNFLRPPPTPCFFFRFLFGVSDYSVRDYLYVNFIEISFVLPWDAVLQKRLAWALFVLLLSTLVCCQPTELILGFLLFHKFSIYPPPPTHTHRVPSLSRSFSQMSSLSSSGSLSPGLFSCNRSSPRNSVLLFGGRGYVLGTFQLGLCANNWKNICKIWSVIHFNVNSIWHFNFKICQSFSSKKKIARSRNFNILCNPKWNWRYSPQKNWDPFSPFTLTNSSNIHQQYSTPLAVFTSNLNHHRGGPTPPELAATVTTTGY